VPEDKKRGFNEISHSSQKQTAELARFPEMNPGPVLQADPEGNIIMSNSAARELFDSRLQSCCWQDIRPICSG